MRAVTHKQIAALSADNWDSLHDGHNPFAGHAFLAALERFGAASSGNGWQPHHLALYEGTQLVGATPAYLKMNSWGEFVFDWAWAEAAHRAGLRYYPKLLAAIPYTPVTGPRLLAQNAPRRRQLAVALKEEAERVGASGAHVNFVTEADADALIEAGFLLREDIQFHWHNPGYSTFDEFLGELTHKRRKAIRHDRRSVHDAGVEFQHVRGGDADSEQWCAMHNFYERTFHRKGNDPVLSLGCFRELGQVPGDDLHLIFALRKRRYIAGALFFRGADTLYGRYWGSTEELPGLHFETCYYQGIEHCIAERITRFEPGAQGEHKMLRGFLPVITASCHWLRHQGLHTAVGRALAQERQYIAEYKKLLESHSPYRRNS